MGLSDAIIVFDNQWKTYYAGQTVTGRVEITVNSPKKVRGVKIRFNGESCVSWTDRRSRTTHEGKEETETIYYSGNETYFNTEYFLIGSQSSEISLPVGQQVYPFTCVLPPTLPSSFEGVHGFVRYTVKVIFDRPWKFDQEVKVAFTVLSPLDLNQNAELTRPARVHLEKYFCCCFCKSGPLTCIVSLPYTGFVPGQTVPVLAEIDNISNVRIDYVTFSFKKKVAYYARAPRYDIKRTVDVLASSRVGPVEAHDSKTVSQPVVVPSLPPSNLTNCSLIDVDYHLHIEVVVSGMHMNLTGEIPIVIGTVPLNMNFMNSRPENVTLNMNGAQMQGQQIGWLTNPDAPPSYDECQFGTNSILDSKDNEHTRVAGNDPNYSPRYPVFNFAPSAPAAN